ncbi:expressed unknown protein [Seminavis robusta]|uniref:ShKT domain-containing protein n=1 Tax=Seminavis robusta TaxID=568900 RepID=A0A9N8EHF9_9STRA|nr:expressed unknown protein [Seminavis robusta]|eukprot:Sro1010_g230830.1 n/a (365) ;mRNA; r:11115-12515
MLKDDEVHVTTKEIELEGKTKVTILEKNETMTIYKTQKVKKVITTETIIEHETVERHLLIAFTTPGRIETILDNDLVFPYPFAALSKQGIWWEDMLQTVKVRYDDPTKLTRFFHIPHRSKLNTPIFVFVKREQTLDDYSKLQTHRRDKFTNWVWDQLKVNVNFINRHSHPVEIWWVHEDQVQRQNTLEADHVAHLTCRLSHTFWVRDARVNQHLTQPQLAKLTKKDLLSENSTMATFNVVKDDPDDQAFTIDIKACFDLDTNCHAWHGCNSNDVADMTHTAIYCRKTCGKCTAADDHAAKLDKQRCKDHQGSCRAWARRGECETNKERTLDSDDFDEDEFAFMEHSDEDSDEEMTGGWSRHDEL